MRSLQRRSVLGFASSLVASSVQIFQTRRSSDSKAEFGDLGRELLMILKASPTSLPVSKLASRITDEGHEALEKLPGGLLAFIRSHPTVFKLAKDPKTSLNVVSLLPDSSASGGGQTAVPPALLDEIESIISAQPFAAVQGVPVARVYSNLSSASRALLRPHKSLIHLLQQFKDRFELTSGNSQVKMVGSSMEDLSETVSSAKIPEAPAQRQETSPGSEDAVTFLDDPFFLKLRETVPFDYFIPVSALLGAGSHIGKLLESHRGGTDNRTSVEILLEKLRRAPEGFAEVRVFEEDNADRIFVRLVAADVPPDVMLERGDTSFRQRFGGLDSLGFKLFSACEEKGIEEFLISDLEETLPPDLVTQIPLKGYASILVFERLPHFFEVSTQDYAVRLRGRQEGGHEYTAASTPLLRALRHVCAAARRPATVGEVASSLHADVVSQINQIFGSLVGFIEAHPMSVFIQNNMVYSTSSSSSAGLTGIRQDLTEEELARAVFDLLPSDTPVLWTRFVLGCRKSLPQVSSLGRDFFVHYSSLFSVYDGLFLNDFIVTRRGAPTPPYVHPPCRTVEDALRQVAIASVGGADEGQINNCISADARSMMKAFGGLEMLLRQIPQWFDVKNERRISGCAFIAYVGHLPKK